MKNANYYTMMEEELKKISDSGSKKKLLLHCCKDGYALAMQEQAV